MDNSIYEPLKDYLSKYKNSVNEESNKFFDELLKKSNVDVEKNKKDVEKIKKEKLKQSNISKNYKKLKTIKSVLNFFTIFFAIVGLIMILFAYYGEDNHIIIGITVAVISFALAIVFLIINLTVIRKKRKAIESLKKDQDSLVNNLIRAAYNDLAPLNNLFDWNMANRIVKNVAPLIDLDENFNVKKEEYLEEKFGLKDNISPNSSTLSVLSGSIEGNPFIVQQTYDMNMGTKKYTGSIVISWTETDREGHVHTHTQTLVASINKPCPRYAKNTRLVFGSEVAPDLSFSRYPSGVNKNSTDKEIANLIKKREKALLEYQEECTKKGRIFTALPNSEFEALFGALDRDNEIQYRMLFSPVAQQNLTKLIKSKDVYGDDFYFYKQKMINVIVSVHDVGFDYSINPNYFTNYDIEESRKNFNAYNTIFFNNLYFDLAPIMSIPLYQTIKPQEYIYHLNHKQNFSSYEVESIANAFDCEVFRPLKTITDIILKTKVVEKHATSDKVEVKAYSFRGVEHVEMISKMGGDGFVHSIPVKWVEYIPADSTSYIEVSNLHTTREEFLKEVENDSQFRNYLEQNIGSFESVYQKGMIAYLIKGDDFSAEDERKVSSILSKYNLNK